MGDTSWKQFERRIAKALGGKRRGADTGGDHDGGKSDVILEGFSVECKLLGRPAWSHFLKAVRQAEQAAAPGEVPLAIIKKKGVEHADALIVFRLETLMKLDVEFWEKTTPEGPQLLRRLVSRMEGGS